jgi:hypothetical protein
MNHVRNSKKTLILAAVVSIMTLSVASSSQTNALTLNEFLNNTFNNQSGRQNQNNNQGRPVAPTQSQNQTPSRQNTPTQNIVEQVVPTTQQPAPTTTVTPTAPAAPAPTQTSAPQAAARTAAPSTAVVAPVDTSAAVVNTANAQAVGESAPNASPYTSNKLDPMLAQKLLFAGIATITAGTLLYAASIIPFGKKQVRHIPVKSL